MGLLGDLWDVVTSPLDLWQGNLDRGSQEHWNRVGLDQANRQFAWNEELARSGIQMRMADAKKAGIAPLAALGMPLSSGGGASVSFQGSKGRSMSGMRKMGQSLERAIGTAFTKEQRRHLVDMQDWEYVNAQLDAEMRRLQIDKLRRDLNGTPAAPNPQGPPTKTVPDIQVSRKGSVTSGTHASFKKTEDNDGGIILTPLEPVDFESDPTGWWHMQKSRGGMYVLAGKVFREWKKNKPLSSFSGSLQLVNYLIFQRRNLDKPPPGRVWKYDLDARNWKLGAPNNNFFLQQSDIGYDGNQKIKRRSRGLRRKAPGHQMKVWKGKHPYHYLNIPRR